MQAERDAIQIEDEEQVSEYAELQQQEAESRSLIRGMVMQPRYALPFLQPGRLARVLTSAEPASGVPLDADAAHEVDPRHDFLSSSYALLLQFLQLMVPVLLTRLAACASYIDCALPLVLLPLHAQRDVGGD